MSQKFTANFRDTKNLRVEQRFVLEKCGENAQFCREIFRFRAFFDGANEVNNFEKLSSDWLLKGGVSLPLRL